MTVCFHTFGCKLNQAETGEIKEQFFEKGWKLGQKGEEADLYVINACAVTQKAEREMRQLIHRLKRDYSRSLLVVTGCFTRKTAEQEKEVDFWVDNSGKKDILRIIRPILGSLKKNSKRTVRTSVERGRSPLRIQTGCRHYCSYCIVPFLRPETSNRPLPEVIKEIKDREKYGDQEVVLVGADIGAYRSESFDLADSLKEILGKTTVPRIRLSSLWPTRINRRLVSLFRDRRLCPHIHLSVQSASSDVLKLMHREYTYTDLRKIVGQLRKIPELTLTADFIVGFPGETEADFRRTKSFVEWAGFLKIHVFRFSPRPQTTAARMKNQVTEETKRKRSRELIETGEKTGQKQRIKFLRKKTSVLVESKQGFYWQGLTPNYLKVYIRDPRDLRNRIVEVELVGLYGQGFTGEIK